MPAATASDAEIKLPLMPTDSNNEHHYEDTPAYAALQQAGLLCREYRRKSIDDIFTGKDLKANTTQQKNMWERFKYGYYLCPGIGCAVYGATHLELFVPASHVGLLMNERNEYLFAQPGMHNIN